MKTLRFLQDYDEYTAGNTVIFIDDSKANDILTIAGIAEITENPRDIPDDAAYADKMMVSNSYQRL